MVLASFNITAGTMNHISQNGPTNRETNLLGRETLHVCTLDDVVQILVKVDNVGVDGDLVFPLELSPHLTELPVGARRRDNVVHDVDVDVIQNDAVSVAGSTRCVVH